MTNENDLIRRADAVETVAQQWLFEASAESPFVSDDDIGDYRKLASELLSDIPSAEAVQVVRCKDCKYYGTMDCQIQESFYGIKDFDFCSYGERKGGDDK